MRTVGLLAAATLALLTPLSCTNTPGPQASTSRLSSPSPVIVNPAASKAADLRVRLDLLLGEHAIVVAKESIAAADRSTEYASYLRLLSTNGSDLTELVRSAFGDTTAGEFDQMWSTQNTDLVDYTIGLVTHNSDKSKLAMSDLINGFVPQFSAFITGATRLPLDPITQLMTEQVLETRAMINDQIAQRYSRTYSDLRTVYAQSSRIGDALAPTIVRKFPDKFPGEPASKAADFRVALSNLLQEHVYLTTMTSGAHLGGRGAEVAAALTALASNRDDLCTLFSGTFGAAAGTQCDQIWGARDAAMVAYTESAAGDGRQNALTNLTGIYVSQFSAFVGNATGQKSGAISSAIQGELQSSMNVIDDQRAKSFSRLATDDRAASASVAAIGDLITAAAVAGLPSKFGL